MEVSSRCDVVACLRDIELIHLLTDGSVYALGSKIDSRSRLAFKNISLRAFDATLHLHPLSGLC